MPTRNVPARCGNQPLPMRERGACSLTRWQIRNHVDASLTEPRDGRPVDDLIPAIYANAKQFSEDAKALGTKYHDAAELMVARIEDGSIVAPEFDPEVSVVTMNALRQWYTDMGLESKYVEINFASPLGYGGRVDWVGAINGKPTIIDWKTQRTKEGKPFRFYPEWAAQLAAYAHGLGYDHDEIDLMSVAISSTEHGRVEHKVWTNGAGYFAAFLTAFDLWKGPLGKNFNPVENARRLAA